MKKNIIGLIISVFIGGCAQYSYVQPGKTVRQMEQDKLQCEYDAEKATVYIQNRITAAFKRAGLIEDCMKMKGYKLEEVSK